MKLEHMIMVALPALTFACGRAQGDPMGACQSLARATAECGDPERATEVGRSCFEMPSAAQDAPDCFETFYQCRQANLGCASADSQSSAAGNHQDCEAELCDCMGEEKSCMNEGGSLADWALFPAHVGLAFGH